MPKHPKNQSEEHIIVPPAREHNDFESSSSSDSLSSGSCDKFSDLRSDETAKCPKPKSHHKKGSKKSGKHDPLSDLADAREASSHESDSESQLSCSSSSSSSSQSIPSSADCSDPLSSIASDKSQNCSPVDLSASPCSDQFSGLASDKSASCGGKKKHSKSKSKRFVVSFGKKHGHPWSDYNHCGEAIVINGKSGPHLHLYRGVTYYFVVNGSGQNALILTASPCGGPGSKPIANSFAPLSKGVAVFKVDEKTPRYFFYQNTAAACQGGCVIVHHSK